MKKTIASMAALVVLLGACSQDAIPKATETSSSAKREMASTSRAVKVGTRTQREFARRPAAPNAQQAEGAEMIRSAVAAVPAKDVPAVMSIVSCMSRTDAGPYDPTRRAERIRTVASDVAAHRPIEGRCAGSAPGSLRDRLTKPAG